jgi:hypothetical protein
MSTLCPVCKKEDVIQKVSSVVDGGTSTGSFSGPTGGVVSIDGKWGYAGGHTTLHGQTSTNLAQQLQPPNKPKEPSRPIGYGMWWLILWIPFSFIIKIGEAIWGDMGYIFGFFVALFLCIFLDKRKRKTNEAKYKLEKPKWDAKMQKWELAMEKWNRAYYCHRDDVAFDPKTNEHEPLSNFIEFLYK